MLECTEVIDFACLSKTYGVLSFHRSTQLRRLSFAVLSELSCREREERWNDGDKIHKSSSTSAKSNESLIQ